MYQGVGVSILRKSLDGTDSEGLRAILILERWLSKFRRDSYQEANMLELWI